MYELVTPGFCSNVSKRGVRVHLLEICTMLDATAKKAELDKVLGVEELTAGTHISPQIIAPGAAALGQLLRGPKEAELMSVE